MSVLVKDMKMPKCCLECPFEDSPEFDSYCIAKNYDFIGKWEDLEAYKPGWCPLQDAPTVGEWIPVRERLPENDELMLVNFKEPRECCATIWIGWHEMENVWYIDGEEHSTERGNEVIAWMPLPEPYREEGER